MSTWAEAGWDFAYRLLVNLVNFKEGFSFSMLPSVVCQKAPHKTAVSLLNEPFVPWDQHKNAPHSFLQRSAPFFSKENKGRS